MPARLAILASGRGSNLQAILDAIAAGRLDARIVGVFSDRPDAQALQRVPEPLRWSRTPKACGGREAFDAVLADAVAACEPDWIVCVGYMRILGEAFVQRFTGRILNIHPALLPNHKGLHTHQRALEAGDREHGCSVHFVTEELDGGPLVVQAVVPVESDDTPESLAQRVHRQEHHIYPLAMRWFAEGRLKLGKTGAQLDGKDLPATGHLIRP